MVEVEALVIMLQLVFLKICQELESMNSDMLNSISTILAEVGIIFLFPVPTKCPGLYCGRTQLENGSYSDCGVCYNYYLVVKQNVFL